MQATDRETGRGGLSVQKVTDLLCRLPYTVDPPLAAFASRSAMNSRENKLAVFIDGASLALAFNESGFVVDFKLLLKAFEQCGNLLRAVYFAE
jgi:hypothetical protein